MKNILILVTSFVLILAIYFIYIDFSKKNSIQNSPQDRPVITSDILSKKMNDFYDVKKIKSEASPKNSIKKIRAIPLVDVQIDYIKSLLMNNNFHRDVIEIDRAIINFLENTKISRQEKIISLWNLSRSNEISEDQQKYLLDYLETLQPIELVDDIIAAFKDNNTNGIKIRYLNLLRTSLNIANPDIQSDEQLSYISEQSEKIEDFYLAQYRSNNEAEILKEIIINLPAVASTENTKAVINELFNKSDNGDNSLFNSTELAALTLEAAFSTEETQQELIPTCLESIKSLPPIDRLSVNDKLYGILRDDEPGNYDSKTLSELEKYVQSQEPTIDNLSFDTLSSYYGWVNSSASVNSKGMSRYAYFENFIINSDSPVKQATIIAFSDAELLSYLDDKTTSKLVNIFEQQINSATSLQAKKLFSDALSNIK